MTMRTSPTTRTTVTSGPPDRLRAYPPRDARDAVCRGDHLRGSARPGAGRPVGVRPPHLVLAGRPARPVGAHAAGRPRAPRAGAGDDVCARHGARRRRVAGPDGPRARAAAAA